LDEDAGDGEAPEGEVILKFSDEFSDEFEDEIDDGTNKLEVTNEQLVFPSAEKLVAQGVQI